MTAGTTPRPSLIPVPPALPTGTRVRLRPEVYRRPEPGPEGTTRLQVYGGDPIALLTLPAPITARIRDGFLEVTDPLSAQVARLLLDRDLATWESPATGPVGPAVPDEQVTVIIPVKDDPRLTRLLAALTAEHPRLPVIVIDDGSRIPVEAPGARVLRHDHPRGPAAARNAGIAAATTGWVALLDADTVPEPGWLEPLLRAAADPQLAAVAPRIVAYAPDRDPLSRYETHHSALDMGPTGGVVGPGGHRSYVPTAAMLLRRIPGVRFAEDLHVGEDVDLCWRLRAAGWRIRYEPSARVGHDHRVRLRPWAKRRFEYGTSAGALAQRHGETMAPLVWSPFSVLVTAGIWSGTPAGAALAAAATGWLWARLRRRVGHELATEMTRYAVRQSLVRGTEALLRPYAPLTLLAALVSPPIGTRVLLASILQAAAGWRRHRDPVAAVAAVGLRRLDDLCYAAGVWASALQTRSWSPVRPVRARLLERRRDR